MLYSQTNITSSQILLIEVMESVHQLALINCALTENRLKSFISAPAIFQTALTGPSLFVVQSKPLHAAVDPCFAALPVAISVAFFTNDRQEGRK